MLARRCVRIRSETRYLLSNTRGLNVHVLIAWLVASSFRTDVSSPWTLFASAQKSVCVDGSVGYDAIEHLNSDIDSEVSRIAKGGKPASVYVYRICPGTRIVLEDDQSLIPKLDGSVFQCGDGSLGMHCELSGGRDQILINRNSELSDEYPMNEVRFAGLTFSGFTNSLISGSASISTTVTVVNSTVSEVNSRYVINQRGDGDDEGGSDNGHPFSVNLFETTFIKVRGGVLVSSDGGNTIIQGSNFVDLELIAIGSVSSGGVMILNDGIIDGGVFENGFVVMQGSSIVVEGLDVSGLQDLQGSMFLADGDGSTVQLANSNVGSNDMRSTPSTWTGIRANDGAIAVVKDTRFSDNFQMRSVITIYGGSRADIDQVIVSNVTGTGLVDTLVSSVVAVDVASRATISRLSIDDVAHFTTSIFLNEGSNILVSQSCLNSGHTQGAAYVSEDSTFSGSRNYINDLMYRTLNTQIACPGPGKRLIQEQPGSKCFEGAPCVTDCKEFGDETVCLARSTLHPSAAPVAQTASLAQTTFQPTPVQADQTTPGPTPTSGTFAPASLRTSQPTPTSGTFTPTNQPTPTSGTWTPTAAAPSAYPANNTVSPTAAPTVSPRPTVSALPSQSPTISSMPSSSPSSLPSAPPTVSPMPSASPSAPPTASSPPPSEVPSGFPSQSPSGEPSESSSPSAAPSEAPSISPTATTSLSPSTSPSEYQTTAAPSASGTRQPQCDCRKYWYAQAQYTSPGYSLGYSGYNGGGGYYGSNRYGDAPKAPKAKSMKGSKGWRERKLPYYNGGGFVQYHYDPCYFYCQWVLHNAYSYNRAYGNGYYGGR